MKKIGHFHHGPVPADEIAKALADSAITVCGRNAEYFEPNSVEPFDKVIVDEGKNSEAIRTAYGDKVISIEDLLGEAPAPEAAVDSTFNPDAPVKARRQPRALGEPTEKGPKKPKVEAQAPAPEAAVDAR